MSKKWRGHMTGEGRGTTKVLGFLGHTLLGSVPEAERGV